MPSKLWKTQPPRPHNDLRAWARDVVAWLDRQTGQKSYLLDGSASLELPFILKGYNIADLPNPALWERGLIYINDDPINPVPAYSDGSAWRRFPRFVQSAARISYSNVAATITSELTAGLTYEIGTRWLVGVFYSIHIEGSSLVQNSIQVDIEQQIDGGGWNTVLNVEDRNFILPIVGTERDSLDGFLFGLPVAGDGSFREFRPQFNSIVNVGFNASTPNRPHTFNYILLAHE